jgi:S-DNA-T family DNA segregation ATPase FtsK/SpoIIIE
MEPEAGPGRLLPDQIEDRLRSVFNKLAGAGLLLVALAAWASLLTWSLEDPTFGSAGAGRTSNALGTIGAILSDLLLQGTGLAAVFATLPLVVWGASLVRTERVPRWRVKLLLWLAATLGIAGALAALPIIAAWPLRHGFGGLLGDLVYALAAGTLKSFNGAHGGAAAGLFLFAGGAAALFASMGAGRDELDMIWRGEARREPRLRMPPLPAGPQVVPEWVNIARGELAERFETRFQRGEGAHSFFARAADLLRNGPGLAQSTVGPARPNDAAPDHAGYHPGAEAVAPLPPAAEADGVASARAEQAELEERSREMAERFAPRREEPSGLAKGARAFLQGLKPARPEEPEYRRPSHNLLKRPPAAQPAPEFSQNVQRGVARLLEDVLVDFGVRGAIQSIKPGPVVTLYELEPARGVKAQRVVGLADDIARSMSATSARIAPLPGRSAIGIELPNGRRDSIRLREVLEADAWKSNGGILPLALGKAIDGSPIAADLAAMPHLLIAGSAGSGLSTGLNAMLASLVYRLGPDRLRLLLIDPKLIELAAWNGIPHLLAPVVTDVPRAVAALGWLAAEMDERLKRMAQLGVRSIELYNTRIANARKRGEVLARTIQTGFDARTGEPLWEREVLDPEPMPYLVAVVDELADLMLASGRDVEAAFQRLAQTSRAAGIHLIVATQRPSLDVVTATLKANFARRASLKLANRTDSRTILGEAGAEQLLGAGDMLLASASGQVARLHGALVTPEEIEQLTAYLRSTGEPRYVTALTADRTAAEPCPADPAAEAPDETYDKATVIVIRERTASVGHLQRRLGISYNRAAGLLERMEREQLVSPADSVGKRHILVGLDGARSQVA